LLAIDQAIDAIDEKSIPISGNSFRDAETVGAGKPGQMMLG